MAEASAKRLVNKIVIRGRIEDIWRELTKNNEPQAAIFNAWLHAQRLAPGAKMQMRTGDGKFTLVIGEVREFDPPHRFAHTFRFTQYDEPECIVIYELKPVADGIEVTLTVDNVTAGNSHREGDGARLDDNSEHAEIGDRNRAPGVGYAHDVLADGPDDVRAAEALPRRGMAALNGGEHDR